MIINIPSLGSNIFDNSLSLKLKVGNGIHIPVYGSASEGVIYINNVGLIPISSGGSNQLIGYLNSISGTFSYDESPVYSTDAVSTTGGDTVIDYGRTFITVTWDAISLRIDILFTLLYTG